MRVAAPVRPLSRRSSWPAPSPGLKPGLLLVGLLVACGYKQEDFAPDYATAVCDLYVDCEILGVSQVYETVEDCEAAVVEEKDEGGGNCDAYDKEKAEQCIQDLEAMSCDDLYAESWPASCDEACAGD